MKRAVAVLVLLVLAGLLARTYLENAGAPTLNTRSEGRVDARGTVHSQAPEEANGSSVPASPHREAVVSAGEEAPSQRVASTFLLRGRFIVVDEHGVEHSAEDGSFELLVGSAGGCTKSAVALRSGAWELAFETPPEWASVLDARIAGRAVYLDSLARLAIPGPTQPLVLRGQWYAPVNLRVLGDDTGSDLASVRVVHSDVWEDFVLEHPGNDPSVDALVVAGRSPLQFSPSNLHGTQRFMVRAPGYAWGSIDMNPADAEEQSLRLVPGGDVVLTFSGGLPPAHSVVRLREAGNSIPLAELTPTRNGPTVIDGLQIGEHLLRLEMGWWTQSPVVIGETSVTVEAGGVATASMTLTGVLDTPPTVRATGTLGVCATGRARSAEELYRTKPE